ncbi:MAG TPA: PqqD family protein [Pyrinomonadaceae bacterium]
MSRAEHSTPRARREQLIVKELANETLIYDENSNEAHCLNQTAAFVWKHCDGRTSIEQLGRLLDKETKGAVSEQLVWSAIEQLEKSHLLEGPVSRPAHVARLSRRALIRNLGLAAAVTVPLVTSIVAPTAAEAASGACSAVNGPCTVDTDCCAGLLCNTGTGMCFNP